MAERYDRQVLLFGAKGQDRIASLTVLIAGLGGLGSHVAQQLAYLGVRSYTLIDPDSVEPSNLNRLIGATERDVLNKTPKVQVAHRVIVSVQPAAKVTELKEALGEHTAPLDGVHFAFGC